MSDSDSDDGGVLFQTATTVTAAAGSRPSQPPPHIVWQQGAIVECFQRAVHVQSHSSDVTQTAWYPPPFVVEQSNVTDAQQLHDKIARWKPQTLILPDWAEECENQNGHQDVHEESLPRAS